MGTDWRDNDPEVEPVVEIYQGHRHNYEHFGAPRSPTEATKIGGYQPKGFIWNALEKGYRLGFESSSDHVSTHLSYAIVYAEDTSRPALIDAFKKRHCYAATDNILLDVRSGDHFMGDMFDHQGEAEPADRRQGDRPGGEAPRHPRQQVRPLDRAERPRRDASATPTTTPSPASRTTTTSASNRPTATSPGARRSGSRTRSDGQLGRLPSPLTPPLGHPLPGGSDFLGLVYLTLTEAKIQFKPVEPRNARVDFLGP